MDRREFLISSGSAAAAVASTSAVAAQDNDGAGVGIEHALIMYMPWADDAKGYADSAHRLAHTINRLSDGRIKIEVTNAPGANGDAAADADLVHASPHAFAQLHPAFSYFGGLPGTLGMPARDLAAWLISTGGQFLWDDLAGQHGWKSLLAGHSGENTPLWSTAPITSLADFANRKVYAPGLAASVAAGLGAESVSLAETELADRLKDNTIDAAEWGSVVASMAAGVPMAAKFALETGLAPAGTALALNVRKSLWNSMTPDDQDLFRRAAAEELQACDTEWRTHHALVKTALQNSAGVSFVATPADIIEARDRISEATVAHIAGHDDLSSQIDRSYMAFRRTLGGVAVS